MKRIYRILFWALALIGFVAFCFLAGDETPERPLSIAEFAAIKATALAACGLCGWGLSRIWKKLEKGEGEI